MSFLEHLNFSKLFIFVSVTLQFLIRPSLPKPPLSCVVCKSARNSASPRILSTWVGPQSTVLGLTNPTEPALASWIGPEWGVEPSLSWLTLWNPAFSAIAGEHISNIEFHLKCYFSLSFLCLRSNKDVICRSGKETELWVETAEASCSFGADTRWYKYWSEGFCQNIHMGLDNPEKIHHPRKWPYSDEIIVKALSRATTCKKILPALRSKSSLTILITFQALM